MTDTSYHPIVIVEVSDDIWSKSTLRYLEEGIWHRQGDLMVRVDSARPEMNLRRHVHIAEPKHVQAKSKQVAWNDDGSRHDRASFNIGFRKLTTAREVAGNALGTGPEIVFEAMSAAQATQIIVEALTETSDAAASDYVEATKLRAVLKKA